MSRVIVRETTHSTVTRRYLQPRLPYTCPPTRLPRPFNISQMNVRETTRSTATWWSSQPYLLFPRLQKFTASFFTTDSSPKLIQCLPFCPPGFSKYRSLAIAPLIPMAQPDPPLPTSLETRARHRINPLSANAAPATNCRISLDPPPPSPICTFESKNLAGCVPETWQRQRSPHCCACEPHTDNNGSRRAAQTNNVSACVNVFVCVCGVWQTSANFPMPPREKPMVCQPTVGQWPTPHQKTTPKLISNTCRATKRQTQINTFKQTTARAQQTNSTRLWKLRGLRQRPLNCFSKKPQTNVDCELHPPQKSKIKPWRKNRGQTSSAASGPTDGLPNNQIMTHSAPKRMAHSNPKHTFTHLPGNKPPNVLSTRSIQSLLSHNNQFQHFYENRTSPANDHAEF